MDITRKAATLIEVLRQLRDDALRHAKNKHQRETFGLAFSYAVDRAVQGHVKTPREAKAVFAAFGDGFCTGVHRAKGTACDEESAHQSAQR